MKAKKYLTEYIIDGIKYGDEVEALSLEDAESKVSQRKNSEVIIGFM